MILTVTNGLEIMGLNDATDISKSTVIFSYSHFRNITNFSYPVYQIYGMDPSSSQNIIISLKF